MYLPEASWLFEALSSTTYTCLGNVEKNVVLMARSDSQIIGGPEGRELVLQPTP